MSNSILPALGMTFPERYDQDNCWLLRKSEIFRYAMEGVTSSDEELINFVSEQCVAAGRLMQIAVSQYESVAHGMHGSACDSRTLPAWMFISCAYSAVDALAAIISALVCGVVPKSERQIPGMGSFRRFLSDNNHANHQILKSLDELANSKWYSSLDMARHRILHRGYWPMRSWTIFSDDCWHLVHSAYFLELDRDGRRNQSLPYLSRGDTLDLFQIADGLLWKLEEWETTIADTLANCKYVKSNWPGPVDQIIRLKDFDYLLPEACFLNGSK